VIFNLKEDVPLLKVKETMQFLPLPEAAVEQEYYQVFTLTETPKPISEVPSPAELQFQLLEES
jgi:hypothetical protein